MATTMVRTQKIMNTNEEQEKGSQEMQSRNILKGRPKQSPVYINIVRGIKKRRSCSK